MIIKLFGKQITINNKKWQQDLLAWSLLYRTEIVIAVASFILGAIIFQMNKQLQQQDFDEQDITSGFIMNLIKLTQQNRRLGKQTINNERESYDNLRQCKNNINKN